MICVGSENARYYPYRMHRGECADRARCGWSRYGRERQPMSQPEYCPHCGVSLLEDFIPLGIQADFGGQTHARRDILVKHRDAGKDVMYLQCPDCGGRWHYFAHGVQGAQGRLRAKAEPYVQGILNPDDDSH
jgi:hypothetical protein